jgi:uncharacterized damage-inducible protein DinB
LKPRFAALIARYSDQPGDLISAVEGLSDAELDKRLASGKWSIRQQVNHVADCELNYVQRMKKVIAEDTPLLPAFESDGWANSLFYQKSSVEDSVALFFTLRVNMTQVLRQLSDGEFARYGIHTDDGKVSLLDILEVAVEHADHHTKAIARIKRKFKIK